MSEYFTTDELAEFLRIKPRKVYDLVSTDKVPYSRVMGKLLFSKSEISNWISGGQNNISNQKNSMKIGKFLSENNELRHIVRRAFIVEKFPYSEIQDNTIDASLVPIDMLRLKLSFFGAVKFDPRSDKWLRINMYQGAPLPHEMKSSNDNWVYNSLN